MIVLKIRRKGLSSLILPKFRVQFFRPELCANFYVTGDIQEALKTRAFSSYYNTANLQTGNSKFNHFD